MNDINLVNVDPQGQVGKSIDTIKIGILDMDIKNYS